MKHVDFLAEILGSTTRARLIRIFLFNHSEVLTVPLLCKRSGIARTPITTELKRLEKSGVVKSLAPRRGSKDRIWALDDSFQYMSALTTFVRDVSPAQFDLITAYLKPVGKISTVILTGSFVGDMSRPVDILLAADELQVKKLEKVLRTLEQLFGREIRYAAFSVAEFRYRMTIQDRLLRDVLDYPHTTLVDKQSVL